MSGRTGSMSTSLIDAQLLANVTVTFRQRALELWKNAHEGVAIMQRFLN